MPGLHPELDYPDTLTSTHPAPPTDKGPSSTADCTPAAAAAAKHSTGDSDATREGAAGQLDQSAAGCSKSAAEAAGGSSKETTQPTDTTPTAADTAAPDEAAPLNSPMPADAHPTKPTPAAPAHPTPASAPDTAAAKSPAAAAAGTPIDWEAALAAAEQDAAALAAYPYPLPGERRPFDDTSSEEEEPYEAEWVAGLIQGKHPAAAVSDPQPPYGSSTAGGSGPFAASATAAAAAVLGGAGAGGSVDGGRMWDPAQLRRENRQLMGFSTRDIPTIKVEWTGNEMVSCCLAVGLLTAAALTVAAVAHDVLPSTAVVVTLQCSSALPGRALCVYVMYVCCADTLLRAGVLCTACCAVLYLQTDTVTCLKAVIAEGDADHLPNHVRGYRIGELVKQKE